MDLLKFFAAKPIWILLIVATTIDANMEPCSKLLNANSEISECCLHDPILDAHNRFLRCPQNLFTCESSKCIMKSNNLLDKNDNLDMPEIDSYFNDIYNKYYEESVSVNRIREFCIRDDRYEKYVMEDTNDYSRCKPLQFNACAHIHHILACRSWVRSPKCAEQQKIVKQCKAALFPTPKPAPSRVISHNPEPRTVSGLRKVEGSNNTYEFHFSFSQLFNLDK